METTTNKINNTTKLCGKRKRDVYEQRDILKSLEDGVKSLYIHKNEQNKPYKTHINIA